MKNNTNYLRSYRKDTALTLKDIATLLGKRDKSYIGRIENGMRPPTIEVVMLYHLLFDVPIDEFFIPQKQDVTEKLLENTATLIDKLQVLPLEQNAKSRVTFLKSVFTKITDLEYEF